MYVGKDQNPATRATVALGKKALIAAQATCPGLAFHLVKYHGFITIDWKPFIKLVPRPDSGFQVQFIESRIPKKFDKEKFGSKLGDLLASRGGDGYDKLKWV